MRATAVRKKPMPMSAWVSGRLFARLRASGGAISAPTMTPTTSPSSERLTQVIPRLHPDARAARDSRMITPSRRSTERKCDGSGPAPAGPSSTARPPSGYKCAMPAEGVRVRLLGRFEIEGIDTAGVRSRKARTLLRVLALAQGAPVPAARLVDIVWGEEPPSEPADQLSVLVSRLRAVLGAGRIDRSDAGYALTVAWSDLAAGTSFLEEGE